VSRLDECDQTESDGQALQADYFYICHRKSMHTRSCDRMRHRIFRLYATYSLPRLSVILYTGTIFTKIRQLGSSYEAGFHLHSRMSLRATTSIDIEIAS
jgi:hypothetical protein